MQTRNTIQRKLVLDTLISLGSHPSPEEIYEAVVEKYPNISKGTVYRNLNLLAQSGEILKVETPDGADRFDHNCHLHYHFQCEKCSRVYDVDMDYMTDIFEKIKDKRGFVFSGCNIMFKGVCPDCK